CWPVFVKLRSARGPFDCATADTADIFIYQSKKDTEFHFEVADNVHETRVDAESSKQKEIIKGKAYRDLEKYDWDKE
ncbi:MAG: DUF4407 domain-containing protein, partial [Pedobacter agri]